jgi:hypothetical protein
MHKLAVSLTGVFTTVFTDYPVVLNFVSHISIILFQFVTTNRTNASRNRRELRVFTCRRTVKCFTKDLTLPQVEFGSRSIFRPKIAGRGVVCAFSAPPTIFLITDYVGPRLRAFSVDLFFTHNDLFLNFS